MKLGREVFLAESEIYRSLGDEDKRFILNGIKRVVPRMILRTKTLFEAVKDTDFDLWLSKLRDKPNLLMLLKLSNGHLIGAFSETPFSP